MENLVKLFEKYLTLPPKVQGFIMGVAVAYPGLVDYLTSYFK